MRKQVMSTINPTDIDWRTLTDAQYKLIVDNKHRAPELLSWRQPNPGFPYFVPMIPSGDNPTLLRLVVENLFWFANETGGERRGVVAMEGKDLWYGKSHRDTFIRSVRAEFSPLLFRWEAVEVYNGFPPEVLKAHATGMRCGGVEEGEAGDFSFEVTRVRRVFSCKEQLPGVRIEKVWQMENEGEVVTFCATDDPAPFLKAQSILEIRGVHLDIDGYHVVEEVFPENDFQECSAFSFLGCGLLGDKVDNDIYLVCDHSTGEFTSPAWGAEKWRVEQEGLYHVKINNVAGDISQTTMPTAQKSFGWDGMGYGSQTTEHFEETQHLVLPRPLAVLDDNGRFVPRKEAQEQGTKHLKLPKPIDCSQRGSDDKSKRTEEAPSQRPELHEADHPHGVHPFTAVQHKPLPLPVAKHLPKPLPISTSGDNDMNGGRGVDKEQLSIPSHPNIVRSEHRFQSAEKVGLPTPAQSTPLAVGTFCGGPKTDVATHESAMKATRAPGASPRGQRSPRSQYEGGMKKLGQGLTKLRSKPDIWNMGVVSRPSSAQSCSQALTQGSETPRSSTKSGLRAKSSGILDDAISPKSPRYSNEVYNPLSSPNASPTGTRHQRDMRSHSVPNRTPHGMVEKQVCTNGSTMDHKGAGPQAKSVNPQILGSEALKRLQTVPEVNGVGRLPLSQILPLPIPDLLKPTDVKKDITTAGTSGLEVRAPKQQDGVGLARRPLTAQRDNAKEVWQPPQPGREQQVSNSNPIAAGEAFSLHSVSKPDNARLLHQGQHSNSPSLGIPRRLSDSTGEDESHGRKKFPDVVSTPPSGSQLGGIFPKPKPHIPIPCSEPTSQRQLTPVPAMDTFATISVSQPVLPRPVKQPVIPIPMRELPKPSITPQVPLGISSKNTQTGRLNEDTSPAKARLSSSMQAAAPSPVLGQGSIGGSQKRPPIPTPVQVSQPDVSKGQPGMNSSLQKGIELSLLDGETETPEAGLARAELTNLVADGSEFGADFLQEVCPEDIDLSGLKKPTCTREQLQHAVIAFRGRLDEMVRRSVQSTLSMFAPNDPSGLTTCQAVLEKIAEMLPTALMQRGDYLYLTPRKLLPVIVGIFETGEIPNAIKEGVLVELFMSLDNVYKTVRVSLSTNQLEQSPQHLYEDLEMEARMKMDEPLLQPRLQHSADGTVQGKVYPGTSTLRQTEQKSPGACPDRQQGLQALLGQPHKPVIPIATRIEEQTRKSTVDLQPSSSLLSVINEDVHPRIDAQKQSLSSHLVDPEGKLEVRAVFDGFDVRNLHNKSNEDVACVVADRLMKSRSLLIKFMIASVEDNGLDIFLDRFQSLRGSTSDAQTTVPSIQSLDENISGGLSFSTLEVDAASKQMDPSPLIMPALMSSSDAVRVPAVPPLLNNKDADILPMPSERFSPTKMDADRVDSLMSALPGGLLGLNLMADTKSDSSLYEESLKAWMPLAGQSKVGQSRFIEKMKDHIETQAPSEPLRNYQEECVQKAEGGGNFIFVAPTGSGKTKIFVEITRRLLQRNLEAKIVVICPTVPLTSQQAKYFANEGFAKQVDAFSGDHPLPPAMWPSTLKQLSILVMTPQIFCSVLNEGFGNLSEIDLLVLDEIHHCRGDHPYSKLMDHYRCTPEEGKRPQVLGFTASPAKSSTMEQACADMQQLVEKTNAQYIVLNEDNEEIQKHVPSAEEENIYIEAREEDQMYSLCMGRYLFNACAKVLVELIACGLAENITGMQELPSQALTDFWMGLHSTIFESWCKKSAEVLEADTATGTEQKKVILSCTQLLRDCNITLELVKEGGYEAAIRYIIKRATVITNDLFCGQRPDENAEYKKLILGLYNIKPIKDVQMTARAFQMTWNLGGYRSFPRYVALVRFLEQYKHRDSFHGIIFCRTRDSVFSLADMLRHTPALYFVTAMEFIGHGKTPGKTPWRTVCRPTMDGSSGGTSSRGMTGSQQRGTLDKFQSPGRHVLVATRAAEEGINITTCAFVVRYSVTETGIERIQSRGRTRVHGGKFVNIVENEGKEGKMFLKSVKEEATMNQVLKFHIHAEHIN